MKIRKVKIGIRDVKTLLNEFADAAGSIEAGNKVKQERRLLYEYPGIPQGIDAEKT